MVALLVNLALAADPTMGVGYYREPSLHGDTLVFVCEGDLWTVSRSGGAATRLTTHPGREGLPQISPDGSMVAFAGTYEGPTETYVMPIAGGAPKRLTYVGIGARPVGWTPDGKVVVATRAGSDLPSTRLSLIDPVTAAATAVPLAEAAQGTWAPDGTLFFTRLAAQGSHTKRYAGGTAQHLWSWAGGAAEALPLTDEYDGTSKEPVWSGGRVYFVSDRDGAMNVWSMGPDGTDKKQHTKHQGFDVSSLSVSNGRLAYRLGADLWVLDLATGADALVPITIGGDDDQVREEWVTAPWDWATSTHVSPDGTSIVVTARGQAFVIPHPQGRTVAIERPGVRLRDAQFLDADQLVTLSDESGEVELWTTPKNGVGEPKQLTHDGAILRWTTTPSPDGKFIAHTDKNKHLWLLTVATGDDALLDTGKTGDISDLAWSRDSRWLAYTWPDANRMSRVSVYDTESKVTIAATTDRFRSWSPSFSNDGKWLYVLSDRHFESVVGHPWDAIRSEPFFDASTEVYAIALRAGARSPYAPVDELHPEDFVEVLPVDKDDAKKRTRKQRKEADEAPVRVTIDAEGLADRILRVPVPPANMGHLTVGDERIYWVQSADPESSGDLMAASIGRLDVEAETLVEGVDDYELSADLSTLLVVGADGPYLLDAGAEEGADLSDAAVDLSSWEFVVDPREEWRQMFEESWRLERDYFYDPGMHGVDWTAIRERYRPLVARVRDRSELSDLVAQMVSELSALHTFVYGGDARLGNDFVTPATLGASLARDEAAGGWRVTSLPKFDPDRPAERPPLAVPGSEVAVGELITAIDGVPSLSVSDTAELLRGKAGEQVLLHVRGLPPEKGRKPAPERDVVVVPIDPWDAWSQRYTSWEETRRARVETAGNGRIGYIHLRAMGAEDIAAWTAAYLPVFDREALIVDVRHNGGGSIDSWILRRLAVKPWMYWSQRDGEPTDWNPQYAFRGHLIVLCDANTGSDGEAFAEGFRRLGLGKVVGTRTWGGEIWLSSSNVLVDGGIATAAEYGVYGPEGTWLIEGRGVEPDVVVDNLPRATFDGGDTQLDTAVRMLLEQLVKEPVIVPAQPAWPDKSR